MHEQFNAGLPPCGVEGLPACEVFHFYDDDLDWAEADLWGEDLEERFPDFGNARIDEDGFIIFDDGSRCAPDTHTNAGDVVACMDAELPEGVFLPDSFEE